MKPLNEFGFVLTEVSPEYLFKKVHYRSFPIKFHIDIELIKRQRNNARKANRKNIVQLYDNWIDIFEDVPYIMANTLEEFRKIFKYDTVSKDYSLFYLGIYFYQTYVSSIECYTCDNGKKEKIFTDEFKNSLQFI